VQSYTSDTIIISPFLKAKKQIYVSLTNSTIYHELDIEEDIKNAFKKRGFEVMEKPDNSPLLLEAKVRYYGIFEKEILNAMLEDRTKKDAISGSSDFQEFQKLTKPRSNVDFSGLVIGAVGGFLVFHNIGLAFGAGIATAGISMLLEGIFEPKILVAMIDVSIFEFTPNKIKVTDFRQIKLGEGGTRKTEFIEEVNFKSYQTKIIVVLKRRYLTENNGLKDAKKQSISAISSII
jgi:hypothetical protein